MRTFLVVAAGLTLASGVIAAAAGSGQAPGEKPKQKVITRTESPAVWVSDDGLPGDEAPMARRLAILDGRGVELGVSIQDLDAKQQATASGALVQEVREDSPAAKAGIKKGDIITDFDGEHVRSARHLSRLVAETPEGRTVKTAVLREGKRVDLSVTPESGAHAGRRIEREFELKVPSPEMFAGRPGDDELMGPGPGSRKFFFDVRPPKGGGPGDFMWFAPGRARLGVGIEELTPQLAEYFGAKDGVLVTSVEPETPAAKAGLKAGDVITSVNGKAVGNGGELIEAVQSAEDGAEVTVGYVRDKKTATAKATLEPREKERIERRVQPI
jgi:serine protease Do